MCLFAVHEPQAEKRFLSPFLLVVPHGIDHLHLVQLSNRNHIVAEIGIADDHVEKHVARRKEQDVEPPLFFVALRQKFIDVAERYLAIGKGRATGQLAKTDRIDADSLHGLQTSHVQRCGRSPMPFAACGSLAGSRSAVTLMRLPPRVTRVPSVHDAGRVQRWPVPSPLSPSRATAGLEVAQVPAGNASAKFDLSLSLAERRGVDGSPAGISLHL